MTAQNQTEETIPGAWSAYSEPTYQDIYIYNEAMTHVNEEPIKYRPIAVSTQSITGGINYRFKCEVFIPDSPLSGDIQNTIEISKPLNGTPNIISISKI